MTLLQRDLFNSPYSGVFCASNDSLTFIPSGIPNDDMEAISEALGTRIEVVTIGGSSVLGTLIAMILVKHPLKYLGIPGIIIIFCGIMLSFYTISIFNETQLLPIPFALVSVGTLLLGFLLLLVSGILFAINRSVFHK